MCRRRVQTGETFVIVESTGQNVWPRSLPGLLRGPAFESWQGPFIALLHFVTRSSLSYTGSVKRASQSDQHCLRYSCFALRLEAQRLERGLCRSFEAALLSSGVAFSNLNTNTATLNQQTLRDRRTSRFQWNISHRSLTLQCLDILNILDDGSISRMRLVVKSRYNGLSPGHSSFVQHAPTSQFF